MKFQKLGDVHVPGLGVLGVPCKVYRSVSPGVNQGQKPREEDGKHVHVSECPRVREPETEAITLVTAVRRRRGVSRGLERKLEVRKEDSKCGQACREAQLRRKDRDCGGRRRQVAPGGSGCREGS